jgi:hypothetical protein
MMKQSRAGQLMTGVLQFFYNIAASLIAGALLLP